MSDMHVTERTAGAWHIVTVTGTSTTRLPKPWAPPSKPPRGCIRRSRWTVPASNTFPAPAERDKLTTLMVTHSMPQAVHLGDRIVMMHKGRVLHDLRGNERARTKAEDFLSRFDDVRRRERLDGPVAEMLKRAYV